MMRFPLLALLLACAHAHPPAPPPSALELVETAPVETSLRHAELREAWQVWPEMIARATARIDFAEMYAVDQPPSRLTPVVDALRQALKRGVRVRFLAEARFATKTYPELVAVLAAHGAQVKKLEKPFLHAKYFVVD